MIDHVLGRPSVKSRRLQVLAVLLLWSLVLYRGHRHGPPGIRALSRLFSTRSTTWRTVVLTLLSAYAARNFSTLVGLAAPEPLASMYDPAYFRATWVMTALDAGFWTSMRLRPAWLRHIASIAFSVFYLFAADRADDKVRRVRGLLTVEHLRVSWNKGTTPYLYTLARLLRPRFTRWPPRALRIPRPAGRSSSSPHSDPVAAWLYFDGPLADLQHHQNVVLDVPGGGYVAMNPRCHDDKLLAWAAKTGLPVLSLDYRKAPEFPYPYALNECYDVYTTIIRTRGRCLGLSGAVTPRIVITGDSAGGNLATAMTLMIIERNAVDRFPPRRRLSGPLPAHLQPPPLPLPAGLVLCYPSLDMNIGNWMTDEQMSLIRDRRMRATNKPIVRRKSREYTSLVGSPCQSDDEDVVGPGPSPPRPPPARAVASRPSATAAAAAGTNRLPQPEYSHGPPTLPSNREIDPAAAAKLPPQPLRTRLATSSVISYFNDRVLTPEMMRAMIILYVGPHNRPDFSQDYFLSPVLAPDSLLECFPKTYFLTGERDPLVDDTVIFAGRLRRAKEALFHRHHPHHHDAAQSPSPSPFQSRAQSQFDDKTAAEVVLIPGISHGFLQVPGLYPPAWKLLFTCAHWIDTIFAALDPAHPAQAAQLFSHKECEDETSLTTATGPPDPNHPSSRSDLSGDEDRPLEISMTRTLKAKLTPSIPTPIRATASASASATTATTTATTATTTTDVSPTMTVPTPSAALAWQQQHRSSDAAEAVNQDEKNTEADDPGQRRPSRRRGNGRVAQDKSLVKLKLKSSDDLLGRRMLGLTDGLTGLPESP